MSHDRLMWLAMMVLAAVMVAAGAGFVTWLVTTSAGKAILAGCSAFAGTVALFIIMATFLVGTPAAPAAAEGRPPGVVSSDAPPPFGSAVSPTAGSPGP